MIMLWLVMLWLVSQAEASQGQVSKETLAFLTQRTRQSWYIFLPVCENMRGESSHLDLKEPAGKSQENGRNQAWDLVTVHLPLKLLFEKIKSCLDHRQALTRCLLFMDAASWTWNYGSIYNIVILGKSTIEILHPCKLSSNQLRERSDVEQQS